MQVGRFFTPDYLNAYAALLKALLPYVLLIFALIAGLSLSPVKGVPLVDWQAITADLGTIPQPLF